MNIYEMVERFTGAEIRLDMGQPDVPVSGKIIEGTKKALTKKTQYTSSSGIPQLRERIAERYGENREHIIVTHGGKLPIAAAVFHARKVLVIAPYWPAYFYCLRSFSKKYEITKTEFEDSWMPEFDKLDSSFDLVIINYPNNPTGVTLPEEKYRELVDLCNDYEITILSDETYRDISFSATPSILDFETDSIFVHSLSKTFSMTGFRLGYAIASKEWIQKIRHFQQITVTCPSNFVQYGALKAFNNYDSVVEKIKKVYHERKSRAERALRDRFDFVSPEGTFYIFPKVPMDSLEFVEKLLKKGVSVFPGEAFGGYRRFVRISLVTERIEEAAARMKKVMDGL
ncbi:MAG: pyridoxal phosphate-dependent aminotransferase [Euryarchaeota archaeon]|nr:pyridoxal phosphate-dependent aminotransferase [Euryarchaeota archaeon]